MLHIILMILKIIGIILLSVLSLILLAILLVLFVPARYKIRASWHSKAAAKVKMTWLLHIISVSIEYTDGELKKAIKIFGFRYKKRERADKPPRKRKPSKKERTQETSPEFMAEPVTEPVMELLMDEQQVVPQLQSVVSEQEIAQQEIPESDAPKLTESEQQEETEEEEFTFIHKLKIFFKMLVDKLRNIRYTLSKIYGKIIHIKDNITYYIEFMQDELNQNAMKLCLDQVLSLMKHIKPRKFRADLIIGMDDPATTGTILAILGIIYPIFEGDLHVTPDFEHSIFDLELYARGRMRASAMLRVAWKIYFNKDFKRMLSNIKKEAV